MEIHIRDVDLKIVEDIRRVSLAMFRKNFFGIFHGSISARVNNNKFLINTKSAIFDDINPQSLTLLHHNKDYRWNEASLDAEIHSNIYESINNAKFIAYAMPPHTVSYSIDHDVLTPLDYFGSQKLGKEIKILDTGGYETWYENADVYIPKYFKEQKDKFLIIRGYGIYAYDRNLYSLAKTIALIENSCRILQLRSKS